MTSDALSFVNDELEKLNIPYSFGEWTDTNVPDPYFVGEYNEVAGVELEENGQQETTFILTGTGRTWKNLHDAKEQIIKITNTTAILPNHNGIAIFYDSSLPIPTGDWEMKRIQINLTIKEWRTN